MERGTMPMSKNKKILLMLAKGGATQSDIAAALHVSKRDVSAGAKVMRECGLTFDAVSSMDADAVDDMFFAKEERRPNDAYLRPDMAALVERKKMSRKLPVKLFWLEYCERPPDHHRPRNRYAPRRSIYLSRPNLSSPDFPPKEPYLMPATLRVILLFSSLLCSNDYCFSFFIHKYK